MAFAHGNARFDQTLVDNLADEIPLRLGQRHNADAAPSLLRPANDLCRNGLGLFHVDVVAIARQTPACIDVIHIEAGIAEKPRTTPRFELRTIGKHVRPGDKGGMSGPVVGLQHDDRKASLARPLQKRHFRRRAAPSLLAAGAGGYRRRSRSASHDPPKRGHVKASSATPRRRLRRRMSRPPEYP